MIEFTAKELAEVGAKAEKRFFRIKWSDHDTRDDHLFDAISRSAARAVVIDRLIAALDDALTGREDMKWYYAALLCDAEEYGLLRFE
jgi:hypothetical protein